MANTSKKWIVDIVKHLPKWFTIIVISCCLLFFAFLAGVSVNTERTVEFFPPKIGPGPKSQALEEMRLSHTKALEELKLIREALNKAGDRHHERIQFLETKLAEAREKIAIAKSKSFDGITESIKWEDSIREYETEIKSLDERYLKQLRDTDTSIAVVVEKLQPRPLN